MDVRVYSLCGDVEELCVEAPCGDWVERVHLTRVTYCVEQGDEVTLHQLYKDFRPCVGLLCREHLPREVEVLVNRAITTGLESLKDSEVDVVTGGGLL